jgi:hypothetical protein
VTLTKHYHDCTSGHNIENFYTFKDKLLQFIKAKWITFEEALNKYSNPPQNHAFGIGVVNANEKGKRGEIVLRAAMENLYRMLM